MTRNYERGSAVACLINEKFFDFRVLEFRVSGCNGLVLATITKTKKNIIIGGGKKINKSCFKWFELLFQSYFDI